jgi:hypothetical protein
LHKILRLKYIRSQEKPSGLPCRKQTLGLKEHRDVLLSLASLCVSVLRTLAVKPRQEEFNEAKRKKWLK